MMRNVGDRGSKRGEDVRAMSQETISYPGRAGAAPDALEALA
jgi:hypothetical protein